MPPSYIFTIETLSNQLEAIKKLIAKTTDPNKLWTYNNRVRAIKERLASMGHTVVEGESEHVKRSENL